MEDLGATAYVGLEFDRALKRVLTELLNCATVRGNSRWRMAVQSQLMETEQKLRRRRLQGGNQI